MAANGKFQGQANYFYHYAPEKIDYAVTRYQTEVGQPLLPSGLTNEAQAKRLYQVLEDHLIQQKGKNQTAAGTEASSAGPTQTLNQSPGPWVVGDKCTIADLACFSWINWAEWAGVRLDDFR